ncbi:hypothetical protein [Actinomadura decatromicini]|uniref:Uncharacterized protein n=1 Tax=Actinomadura decatromicini TaxID=2604572 RepID=A0A5D3FZJ9_9ACTN|nr:hypothetical protein [Actinomadura decatromicini]TYK53150.1 hypothetical protein FXF68_05355 [Actinomadura decatromicini]
MHIDTTLFQRANLFLVAESLLVVGYATIISSAKASGSPLSAADTEFAARVIIAFGLLLTLTWLYVGHRHLRFFKVIIRLCRERLPEFAETYTMRGRGPSSLPLLTYVLPCLAGAMWTALLVVT